jgi:outer membrane biosynthesis protein TonB
MDFEPHNFPALVTSVIRSDPRLAEPLKEIFAAYARSEDLEEIWARIDSKFHQSLRLILDDLNEIDDPVSLDQEVQSLLTAIDEALVAVEHEAALAPETDAGASSVKKVKKKAKAAGKKAAKKPAGKKKAVKKAAAAKKPAKKKAVKAAKKKAAKPAKKKAVKKAAAAKKPVKKKAAKPAKKKAAKPAKKKAKKK